MWKNRIIYIVLLVASGVFASYYGGNIPKMLFFLLLSVPLFSLLYTLLIYFGFRIYQDVPAVKVVKNQIVPYHFILANQEIFPFSNIKINFFGDYSVIEEDKIQKQFSVLPRSRVEMNSYLCGKYRGSYNAGVNSVEITDYLCLFTIRYPLVSKLKIIVWPRVLDLEKLNLTDSMMDSKNLKFSFHPQSDELDLELRKFAPGDSRKLIHWKASAKKRELLTRKSAEDEKTKTVLFMDLFPVENATLKIEKEDKIIETALAIAKFYLKHGEPIQVVYDGAGAQYDNYKIRLRQNLYQRENSKMKYLEVINQKAFEYLYQDCVHLCFKSPEREEEVLLHFLEKPDNNYMFYILVSTHFDRTIYDRVCELHNAGADITYFYVNETKEKNKEEEQKNLFSDLRKQGIRFYRILPEDDLEKVFSE